MLRSALDRAFVRYARTGEPGALAKVFDGSAVELYRLAYHLLGDRHAAEDLVQQTFVVAIEQAKTFERGRRVLPWLCGILSNRALHVRRQLRQRAVAVAGELREGVADPVAEAAAHETTAAVAAQVRSLPEPYRQVLLLHLVHELTPKEIAEALLRPDATVRTQLARGLELLRKVLPLGIGGVAMGAVPPPHGLLAVRSAVLAHAGTIAAPVAVGGVGVITLWGVLVMKKVLLVMAVLFAVLCAWPWWRADAAPPAKVDAARASGASEVAVSPVPIAANDAGAADRVLVPAADAAKTASLDVAVSWSDGTPAVDEPVRCRPLPFDVELWLRVARTDEHGVAHFAKLPPGKANVMTVRGGKVDVVLAAGEAQHAAIAEAPGIDVRGHVVDLEQHAIAGASVWMSVSEMSDDSEPVTVTAADGSFTIRSGGKGQTLMATAPGLGCAQVAFVDKEEVVLVLRPAPGVLVGTVLDPRGVPVAGARVLVGVTMTEAWRGVHKRIFGRIYEQDLWPSRFLRSDEHGVFRCEGLPPLPWPVWAGAPGFAGALQEVQVLADRETSVTMQLTSGGVVRGRITDARGTPVVGSQAMLLPKLPAAHALIGLGLDVFEPPLWVHSFTKTDADGRFRFTEVRPGKYRLIAWVDHVNITQECELAEGQTLVCDLAFGVDATLPLHGIVVDDEGSPLEGWSVRIDEPVLPHYPSRIGIGHGGTFRTYPVTPGAHRLLLQPREPILGAEFDAGEFDVANCPLRIVVPRAFVPTGMLRGRIELSGAEPSQGRIVVQRADSQQNVTVPVDAEGAFVAGPLQRGSYQLKFDDVDSQVSIGRFDVADGKTTDCGTLHVPAPGTLVVTIVDANGKRRPDAWVSTRPIGDNDRRAILEHKEGIARGNLPAGRWLVASRELTPMSKAVEVDVRAGETTELRFVVPDGVPFTLRVPKGARELDGLRARFHDANGALLRDDRLQGDAGTDLPLSAPPGHYTLDVTTAAGQTASTTFDLHAGDSPPVVELPLPAR